ncbi:Histone-lysine N-methyltransferase SETMAR [Eumeta japonica]|uniref:Histone-lysine N-methyltransferase SETMAR n=1 Tax=Eumeta variegata TaxID=151549 RepID=A0A4C1ZRR7_EUMVA|nr:Histone-lysine N-methyltransferase SETMAR [Eumeta japonica]
MNLALVDLLRIKSKPFFKKVEQDQDISSYDIAGKLGIDYNTILTHLKKAGHREKLNTRVQHELTERKLMNRVLICDSLLKRNETEPFFQKIDNSNRKWITYDKNVRRKIMVKRQDRSTD